MKTKDPQNLLLVCNSQGEKNHINKIFFKNRERLVKSTQNKILAGQKAATSWKRRGGAGGDEGGQELSGALVQSLQREQLERQAAALATSGAPLAWRGARPRREDSGLAFPNNGQAL